MKSHSVLESWDDNVKWATVLIASVKTRFYVCVSFGEVNQTKVPLTATAAGKDNTYLQLKLLTYSVCNIFL